MRTRIHFEWLIVASVLCASTARAQDGVASVGPGPSYFTPSSYESGGAYCPPGGFQPAAHYSADLYAELLPQDRGWFYDHDSRLDLTLREMFRGSWLRLEFLNSHVERDSNGSVIGAPTQLPGGAVEPFPILANDGVTNVIVQAMTTRGLSWENMQGIRGSFGLKLLDEVFLEGSAWGTQEQLTHVQAPDLFPIGTVGFGGALLPNAIIVPILFNDQTGTGFVLFDVAGFGEYRSQLFVGQTNLVIDWINRNNGVTLKALVGYRHEQYDENFLYGGIRNNSTGILPGPVEDPAIISFFESEVRNYRDEFQFGIRNEYEYWRLKFGIEPKVGLGTNLAKSSLELTGAPTTADRSVQFAQSFDLDVYLKMALTEWFSLRVGYNMLWMGRVGVADASVRYNTFGGFPLNDTKSRLQNENRTAQSFTFGGEVLLP